MYDMENMWEVLWEWPNGYADATTEWYCRSSLCPHRARAIWPMNIFGSTKLTINISTHSQEHTHKYAALCVHTNIIYNLLLCDCERHDDSVAYQALKWAPHAMAQKRTHIRVTFTHMHTLNTHTHTNWLVVAGVWWRAMAAGPPYSAIYMACSSAMCVMRHKLLGLCCSKEQPHITDHTLSHFFSNPSS